MCGQLCVSFLDDQQLCSLLTGRYFIVSLEMSVIKRSSASVLPLFIEATFMVIYHSDNVQSHRIARVIVVKMAMAARSWAGDSTNLLLELLGQYTGGHEITVVVVLIVGCRHVIFPS
jgi:hypothetical protein